MQGSKNAVTGIVLAGGKSLRMGFDKGLAETKEGRLIELIITALQKTTTDIIIVANTRSYDYLGFPVFEDLIKDCGPLGGIYTGLYHSKTSNNIIVACDMPFVTDTLFNTLLNESDNRQIVIPAVNDRMEPLCGLYKKEIQTQLKSFIDKEMLSVHQVIRHFNHAIIPFKGQTTAFANINTPEDLRNIAS